MMAIMTEFSRLFTPRSSLRSGAFVAICAVFFTSVSRSQILHENGQRLDSSTVIPSRLAIFGGTSLACGVGIHFARYVPLWKDHYTTFRVREDFTYARNQDKLLHFYGGAIGSTISAKALLWTGYDQPNASLIGAATSLTFLTFMKIEDGHIDYLGFDRADELANIVGAAYPLAQYYVPFLDNFTPKFSYIASKNSVVTENQTLPKFLEDHEGQKFWMGITVYNLLPKDLQKYWLPAVGLAVGYTVRDLDTPKPYHETILALDLDLRKLPGNSHFLRTMWEMLNYVHLPMPAVRISPSIIWYGLYF